MRVSGSGGDFKARAIAGTHTVLIALDCPQARRKGLKGFAFQREMVGPGSPGAKFLRSQKVFKSVVPDPKNAHEPDRPSQAGAILHRQIPGAELSVGRLCGVAGDALSLCASSRCTATPAR